jgi:hypothetical protein
VIYFVVAQHREDGGGDDDDDHWKIYNRKLLCLQEDN